MKVVVANSVGRFSGNRFPCPFPSRWTSIVPEYPVFTFFPYELAYLSSLLKRDLKTASVKMIDGTRLRFTADDYLQWLDLEKPDWLIFEADSVTYGEILKVCIQAKKRYGTKIIITGQYPTVYPEKVLKDGCHYACIGEYEETVLEILQGVEPASIAGLHPNGYRKVIEIDSLPDPEDEDIRRIDYAYAGGFRWTKYRSIELHASRGCPYRCDFCVAGTVYYEKNSWRIRSPKRIMAELNDLRKKYPEIEGVFFDEETHIVNKKKTLALCEAIIASGNSDIHYEAMANHQLLDEELLKAMKKAGYYKLRIGIETIDDLTSKSIGRKSKPDKLLELLATAKRIGMEMYGTFIVGASGSSKQGDLATIEYGKKLVAGGLISSWQCSIAVPHPGTPFHDKAVKNGWLQSSNLEDFNGNMGSVVSYPNYSSKEITKMVDFMRHSFDDAVPDCKEKKYRSDHDKRMSLSEKEKTIVKNKMPELKQLFNSKQYKEVIEKAGSITADHPKIFSVKYLLASSLYKLGRADEAEPLFINMAADATDYTYAIGWRHGSLFHLAEIEMQRGEEEAAYLKYMEVMHLCPDHKTARERYWSILKNRAKTALNTEV